MKIIAERHHVTKTEYNRCFEYENEPDCGYWFPCDENGNVSLSELSKEALQNYQDCINGKRNLIDGGICKNNFSYTEPAIGICDKCGKEVSLIDSYCGATECECGEWYNMCGQHLNPPEMWQEEIDYE